MQKAYKAVSRIYNVQLTWTIKIKKKYVTYKGYKEYKELEAIIFT